MNQNGQSRDARESGPAGRTCVIGAGSSGIACAKVLHDREIPFDCFEKGSGIGGLWRYQNDNGMSNIYRSLHINTSRDWMQFPDYPMPRDYPPFPGHQQILRYFEDYVDHFGFRDRIRFRTGVERVEPAADGTWDVTIREAGGAEETRNYAAVCVANGHHWNPRWPSFPGTFDGRVLHSHDYRTPESFAGQRVLVVGFGNSACDIACEVSRVAETTFMSTRRGAHILPKFLFGLPSDRLLPPVVWRNVPLSVIRIAINSVLWIARGPHWQFGLPNPKHRLFEEHPTISCDVLNYIGHGYLKPKPTIAELLGDKVKFVDGSIEPIDTIIYATGYNITFPFLSQSIIAPVENQVELYKCVVPPQSPGLYFIGLLQPWGPIMPLAHRQSRWVADLIAGAATLPDRQTMMDDIERRRTKMARRYVASPRHTIQVDYYPYLDELDSEQREGRKRRARDAGAAANGAGASIGHVQSAS